MEVNNTVFFRFTVCKPEKKWQKYPVYKGVLHSGTSPWQRRCYFLLILEHFFYTDHVLMFWLVFTVTAFTWRAKRFTFASFLHLLLLHDFSGISGNSEKNILLTIEQLMKGSYKRKFFWSFFSEQALAKGSCP